MRYSRNAARFSRFWNQAPADDYELKQHRMGLLKRGDTDDASSIRSKHTLAPPSTSTRNGRSPLSTYGSPTQESHPRAKECQSSRAHRRLSARRAPVALVSGRSERPDADIRLILTLRRVDWLRRWRPRGCSRLPVRRIQPYVHFLLRSRQQSPITPLTSRPLTLSSSCRRVL